MYLIRQSRPEDVGTLTKLAKMVYFINLPPDERIIGEKIAHSRACFRRAVGAPDQDARPGRGGKGHSGLSNMKESSDLFMFSIIDAATDGVIGSCQIISRMGGPGRPNWSFKLSEKKFFSKGLNYGTTHTVARLFGDETGPSEVGGLILSPSYRGARGKPGRFLSHSRFLFCGMRPDLFSERIIAEMAAPVTSDGDNMFWDAVCRKFIPVKYAEADRFCQHNRDFIPELLPHDDIYLTLLPLEVLNLVAQVGEETRPARRMLEKMGFSYKGHIDPFDGGPHLEARVRDIPIVKATKTLSAGVRQGPGDAAVMVGIIHPNGEYRAVMCNASLSGGTAHLPAKALAMLEVEPGAKVGVAPIGPAEPELDEEGSARPAKRGARKPAARTSAPADKKKPARSAGGKVRS